MLVALLAAVWLVLAVLGLTMFRAAARSDACHSAALADWVRAQVNERGAGSPGGAREHPRRSRRDPFRASG